VALSVLLLGADRALAYAGPGVDVTFISYAMTRRWAYRSLPGRRRASRRWETNGSGTMDLVVAERVLDVGRAGPRPAERQLHWCTTVRACRGAWRGPPVLS